MKPVPAVVALVVFSPLLMLATDVPNTFAEGAVASALEMNANFAEVGAHIDSIGGVEVPIITGWQSYDPGDGQGWGTTTGRQFFYRRVGDSVEIQGRWTCGTVTAVEAQMPLPPGLQVSSQYATIQVVGQMATTNPTSGDNNYVLATGGDTFLNFARQKVTESVGANWNTGETEELWASVRIEGWAATQTIAAAGGL